MGGARDAVMAEDLYQEVLLKIHRARHTYDPAKPFAPWFSSVTRNTIFDHLRRKRLESKVEALRDQDAIPGASTSVDDAILVRAALERLSETHRIAIELVHLQGLSLEEAAARLGIGLDAMKARSHRAYKALEGLLLMEEGNS